MRKATITLDPKSGTINQFYAYVDGVAVIGDSGKQKRIWSGPVGDSNVLFKIQAYGIHGSTYTCEIKCSGSSGVPQHLRTLDGGKNEFEKSL